MGQGRPVAVRSLQRGTRGERPHLLEADARAAAPVGDGLELAQRRAELAPVLQVVDGQPEGAPGRAHAHRRHGQPGERQGPDQRPVGQVDLGEPPRRGAVEVDGRDGQAGIDRRRLDDGEALGTTIDGVQVRPDVVGGDDHQHIGRRRPGRRPAWSPTAAAWSPRPPSWRTPPGPNAGPVLGWPTPARSRPRARRPSARRPAPSPRRAGGS